MNKSTNPAPGIPANAHPEWCDPRHCQAYDLELHLDDRQHMGAETEIPQSLVAQYRDQNGALHPRSVRVSLGQGVRETAPRVALVIEQDRPQCPEGQAYLTPAEAAELAQALLGVVAQVGGEMS